MKFTIDKRIITCDEKHLIGDNANYEACFEFDDEWLGETKTARFQMDKKYVDVVLNDNKCNIPVEILKQGILMVGVYSDEMSTMPCTLKVKPSIKEKSGSVAKPYDDVYEQLLDMLDDLYTNGLPAEQIEKAVKDYFTENPGLSEEDINTLLHDYLGEQNIPTDIAQAQKDIVKFAHESAGAIIVPVSGSVVSVADASDKAFDHITLYGKSTQDGTPSIDAPVDIMSVGDDGNVKMNVIGSKNLIDLSKGSNGTNSGLTAKVNTDGSVSVTGTATATNIDIWLSGGYFKTTTLFRLTKGRYYIKDVVLFYGQNSVNTNCFIGDNGAFINLTKDINITAVRCPRAVIDTEYNVTLYPMIVKSDVEVDFDTYQGQSATIDLSEPLRGLPVTSGGNYTDADGQQWICDTLEVFADGTGKLTQRVYGGLLDGTQYVNELSAFTGVKETVLNFRSSIKGLKKSGQIISTHLTKTLIWSADIEGMQIIEQNAVDYTIAYEKIGVTSSATTEEKITACKAYLIKNPIEFVAEMHTPIVTELTAEQVQSFVALHSYKPHTVITTDDMCDIAVEYIADSKIYIDNKFTELANMIVASGATTE